jgi:predicted transcriptional regulator of viral defense system
MHELVDRLRKSKMAVFSLEDICRFGGLGRSEGSVYVHRMLKRNLIQRIQRGKYTVTDDPFVVSSQLVTPSYISFLSSLYLHGKLEQSLNTIFIVSPYKRPRCEVFGMEARFVKFQPSLIFGFKKVRKGESYVSLAELEKTILDILYLPRYARIGTIANLVREVDTCKLQEYARRMGEAVVRRTGYLLDRAGIEHGLKPGTKCVYRLNPSIPSLGSLDKKWLLYVNEELDSC